MWQALEENSSYLKDKTLLYIHSGGVMGNESQLQRYKDRF
jgi:1-aminocyclopropane-1-carboxylate deaminase/D-cysteine desulfhydrase-like pyridoxal-dependent ACC family enzyme